MPVGSPFGPRWIFAAETTFASRIRSPFVRFPEDRAMRVGSSWRAARRAAAATALKLDYIPDDRERRDGGGERGGGGMEVIVIR
jgi:hypothetical protein